MQLAEYVKDRTLLGAFGMNEVYRFLTENGPLFERKPITREVGKRIIHFAAALDRSTNDEDTRRLVNQALDYMGGVYARSTHHGKQMGVARFEAGHFMSDGAIVEICPVCQLGGVPRTEGPDSGRTVAYVHEFQIKLEGLLPTDECMVA